MNDVNACYYSSDAKSSAALPLLQRYDAGRVQRFHTTPDYSGAARQTVAEHSWGVALIAVELCRRTGTRPSSALLEATLLHDLSEYWSFDAPAHVKWLYGELTSTLDKVQEEIELHRGLSVPLDTWDQRVLWWADKLELYLYSIQRARAGVNAYRAVATNIEKYMRDNSYGSAAVSPTLDAGALGLLNELRGALT